VLVICSPSLEQSDSRLSVKIEAVKAQRRPSDQRTAVIEDA
jgi:hypothetical protein